MKNFYVLAFLLIALFGLSSCFKSDKQPENPNTSNGSQNKPADVAQQQPQADVVSDKVVMQLSEKLRSNPNDATLHFDLGKRYSGLKRFDLASTEIQKAIEIDAQNADYKLALANVFADWGQIDKAEELFAEMVKNNPEKLDVIISWGVMYLNTSMMNPRDEKSMKAAKEKFDSVLAKEPDNVKALYDLGLLYITHDKLDLAKQNFQHYYQLEPGRINAIQHLANIALREKNWDDLKLYATKGLEIEQKPELVYYLGRVAYEKGDMTEAKKEFEKFLTMNYFGPLEQDAREKLLKISGIK